MEPADVNFSVDALAPREMASEGDRCGAPGSFSQELPVRPAGYAGLTRRAFFVNSLLPATAGNVIGGAFMVGLAGWLLYLRPSWTGHPAEDA